MGTLSFKQYIIESEKVVYATFSKMSVPSTSHEKMISRLAEEANGNPYRVYLARENSLAENVKYARKILPKHARQIVSNQNVKSFMDMLADLHESGFKNVVVLAGSNRVREYQILAEKYNGREGRHGFYNFESVQVKSIGQKDPDLNKDLNEAATNNDFIKFQSAIPSSASTDITRQLFSEFRKSIGLEEEPQYKAKVQFEPVSESRELYVKGELFEVGERVVIKESSQVGKIKQLGSNYLLIDVGNDCILRKWIDDVEKLI